MGIVNWHAIVGDRYTRAHVMDVFCFKGLKELAVGFCPNLKLPIIPPIDVVPE